MGPQILLKKEKTAKDVTQEPGLLAQKHDVQVYDHKNFSYSSAAFQV